MSDTPVKRDSFPVDGNSEVPVGPGHATSFDRGHIDFGHYAGQSIEELARVDPDYLRWLAHHPSGARYRVEIERVLGPISIVPGR